MSVQRDYILRMVELFGLAWASVVRIIKLREAGQHVDAVAAIDQELRRLLRLTTETVEALSGEELLTLLRLSQSARLGQTVALDKLLLLALLLEEMAALYAAQGTEERADDHALKALQVYLALVAEGHDPAMPDVAADIEGLARQVGGDAPPDTRRQLWQYYEQTGQFARAEDWLFEWLESVAQPKSSGVVADGVAYYERLLLKSDAELEQGNLPRDEVLAGLAQLQARR